MQCPKCGVEIPDESTFCNKCGTALKETDGEAPTGHLPEDVLAPEKQMSYGPESEKRNEWTGRPSIKARTLFNAILFVFVVVPCTTLYFFVSAEKNAWLHWGAVAVAAIVLLYVVITFVRAGYRMLSTSYELSSQRLFVKQGLFSQVINEIELIRVDDVQVSRNVFERMLGVGHVHVISTDRSEPDLFLHAIRDPVGVKDMIRRFTQKRRKKSLHIENI